MFPRMTSPIRPGVAQNTVRVGQVFRVIDKDTVQITYIAAARLQTPVVKKPNHGFKVGQLVSVVTKPPTDFSLVSVSAKNPDGSLPDPAKRPPLPPVPDPVPPPPPTPVPPTPDPPTPPSDTRSDAGLNPVVVNIGGLPQIYQSPKNAKGLVVFLHGCSRSAFGGWPKSAGNKFLGMPEDVGRTKQCLASGYAILYLSPKASSGCFSHTDGDNVVKSINQVRSSLGLQGKPLYLGGCSAGGGLIQRLVASGSIRCDGMFNESSTSGVPSNKTPASLWTVLSTAKEKAAADGHAQELRHFGKPAAVLVSGKRVITPDFFYNQFASISLENSKRIATSLRSSGLIDAGGNIVKDPKNPREWYSKLQKDVKIPETSEKFWDSGIVQEMMTAYAVHDAVSCYMTTFLKWAESGFKANVNDIAKQYEVLKPAFVVV